MAVAAPPAAYNPSDTLIRDCSGKAPLEEQTRETFSAGELAVVLSHYDLGVIEAITGYPRGSRRSPKAGIVAQRGKFLLKTPGG